MATKESNTSIGISLSSLLWRPRNLYFPRDCLSSRDCLRTNGGNRRPPCCQCDQMQNCEGGCETIYLYFKSTQNIGTSCRAAMTLCEVFTLRADPEPGGQRRMTSDGQLTDCAWWMCRRPVSAPWNDIPVDYGCYDVDLWGRFGLEIVLSIIVHLLDTFCT